MTSRMWMSPEPTWNARNPSSQRIIRTAASKASMFLSNLGEGVEKNSAQPCFPVPYQSPLTLNEGMLQALETGVCAILNALVFSV